MPLIKFLQGNAHLPAGWHRQQERQAQNVHPITSITTQLEPWERQLVTNNKNTNIYGPSCCRLGWVGTYIYPLRHHHTMTGLPRPHTLAKVVFLLLRLLQVAVFVFLLLHWEVLLLLMDDTGTSHGGVDMDDPIMLPLPDELTTTTTTTTSRTHQNDTIATDDNSKHPHDAVYDMTPV
jgi:hypothetical protein